MKELKATNIKGNELEIIHWLIDRNDNIRSSSSNRASIILSVNAIVLAGFTFLLDYIFRNQNNWDRYFKLIICSNLLIGIIFVILSIYNSTAGIITLWKKSNEAYKLGLNKNNRLFYHPRDTIEKFKSFQLFKNEFVESSHNDIIHYALAELWTVTHTFQYRYQKLRKSILFLFVSFIPFIVILIMLLLKFIF